MINNCNNCKYFNFQEDAKLFGHPCDLHGVANPYICNDYKNKSDDQSDDERMI